MELEFEILFARDLNVRRINIWKPNGNASCRSHMAKAIKDDYFLYDKVTSERVDNTRSESLSTDKMAS